MGDSIWVQASEKHFEELADESPEIVWPIVNHYKKFLRDNGYDYDIFGQYHQERFITPAEIYDYANIRFWMDTGALTGTIIYLGEYPSIDKEISDNNNKLSALQNGIKAKFFGGLGDDDGYLKGDIQLTLTNDVAGVKRALQPKWSAPLEVGYTSYTRSYCHLLMEGYLARWPYESKNIYLFALEQSCMAHIEFEL